MIRLTLLLLLAASPAFAQSKAEYADIVERAMEAVDWDFEKKWAFTETRLEEKKVWVGRYDPRLPKNDRWLLISVDGREPTEEEVEEYADEQDDHDHDSGQNIGATMEPDTLELIEETDEHWLFSFEPDSDEGDFMEHVDASLKVVKNGHYVEFVDLRATEAFKPAFAVKLSKFLTRLTFGPVHEDGPIVPRSIEAIVKGRAFLVVSFDETTEIAYTDFEYAGEAQ